MYKFSPKLLLFVVTAILCTSLAGFAQKKPAKPKATQDIKTTPKSTPVVSVKTPPKTNTTANNFSSKIQQDIFNEINTLRTNPEVYIKILEEMKSGIKGKVTKLPDGTDWQMNEGVSALEDAIKSLKLHTKSNPYSFSNGLTKAAEIQLSNLKEDMSLGHFGKDGSDIEVRLRSVGFPGEMYAENIAYFAKDARSVVLIMIIDDGLKSRSHRKNLLSNQFRELGVAFGNGKNNVALCVVVFADNFIEKKAK